MAFRIGEKRPHSGTEGQGVGLQSLHLLEAQISQIGMKKWEKSRVIESLAFNK